MNTRDTVEELVWLAWEHAPDWAYQCAATALELGDLETAACVAWRGIVDRHDSPAALLESNGVPSDFLYRMGWDK